MKEVVILVPGFAASHLYKWVEHRQRYEKIWLNQVDIAWSGIGHLRIPFVEPAESERNVYPSGILGEVYQPFMTYCNNRALLVHEFAYDWRLDIQHNGRLLAAELTRWIEADAMLTVVGHSMGGLVAAKALQLIGERTKQIIRRFVSCGTPWRGSYRAVELLAGEHDIIKKIVGFNAVFSSRSKYQWSKESVSVVATWPGVYDMLPMPDMMREYPPGRGQDFTAEPFFEKINPVYQGGMYRAAIARSPIYLGLPPQIQHYNWRGVGLTTSGPMPSVHDGYPDWWFKGLLGDTTVPEFSSWQPQAFNSIGTDFIAEHEQFLNDPAVLTRFGRLMGIA